MGFFDRLSNGWKISMNSFKVLKENKQLVIFPILSGISLLLILSSFVTIMLAAAGWDTEAIEEPGQTTSILYLFLYYLVNYFVVVFFNTALVHCTRLYFQGEEVTIEKGLRFSLSRIGSIFAWSMFAATVGTVLRLIQENAGWLGKILAGLIGIVWSVATFFVVPVIAYENVGPLQAFKRSSQLMKEKWGERLGAGFSFGLVQIVALLVVGLPLFFIGAIAHPAVGIVLAVLGCLLVMAVISAAQTIFVSAVYHNVTGDPVQHFNQQLIDNLFESKS
jgi:nitrate reductase gamma subunit